MIMRKRTMATFFLPEDEKLFLDFEKNVVFKDAEFSKWSFSKEANSVTYKKESLCCAGCDGDVGVEPNTVSMANGWDSTEFFEYLE